MIPHLRQLLASRREHLIGWRDVFNIICGDVAAAVRRASSHQE